MVALISIDQNVARLDLSPFAGADHGHCANWKKISRLEVNYLIFNLKFVNFI
jgi:hypothetical protein